MQEHRMESIQNWDILILWCVLWEVIQVLPHLLDFCVEEIHKVLHKVSKLSHSDSGLDWIVHIRLYNSAYSFLLSATARYLFAKEATLCLFDRCFVRSSSIFNASESSCMWYFLHSFSMWWIFFLVSFTSGVNHSTCLLSAMDLDWKGACLSKASQKICQIVGLDYWEEYPHSNPAWCQQT